MDKMKWIELIRARSFVLMLQEAMASLQKQIKEIEEKASSAKTFFMQLPLYSSDLAVYVVLMNGVKPDQTR
jgi:transposase